MKHTIITVIIFLFLLAACDNEVDPVLDFQTDSDTNTTYTVTPSDEGDDISLFLGWKWGKESSFNGTDYDFTYLFQIDGTISVIHCCGEEFHDQFSYFFLGDVLVTYGSEMDFDAIEVTNFTVADDGLSFTLNNGTKFIRGEARDTSSFGQALVLSNVLLGTWIVDDGKKYIFGSDASLKIDSDRYGYLVRKNNELLTLGPLVDGTQAVLQKYKFKLTGNMLFLQYTANGKTNTISLSKTE